MRVALLALVALLIAPAAARAAQATVAVMPFRDLSGKKASVGEAIRETVTADLREAGGVTVIERGEIDRVLGEQALQARRADLDPSSTVRVGKLLGASLIVTGAYQETGGAVRLTARFVRVESGEIVGTAKVDGAAHDLLRLQDRVTTQLMRSAGMDAARIRKVAERPRPRLRGLRGLELYGDALAEADDERKGAILRQALDAEPGLSYALRDLEALERRMKGYARAADVAQQRAQRELRDQIAGETDPLKRAQLQVQLFGQLHAARRYRQLIQDARQVLTAPSPPPPPGNVRIDELAAFYLMTAESQLHERDALLRDGEAFLRRFPTSVYFKTAEQLMKTAIAERRKEEEGKARAASEAAALRSADRWDPCNLARIYEQASQHREAQRLFRACLLVGARDRVQTIQELVLQDVACADWAAARRDLLLLEGEKDGRAAAVKQGLELVIPADG